MNNNFYYSPHMYLSHHGIKGQKWGVRRYQNPDGTLTSAGRKRYSPGEAMNTKEKGDSAITRRVKKDYNTLSDSDFLKKYSATKEVYRRRVNRYGDPYMNSPIARVGKNLKQRSKDVETIIRSLNTRKYIEITSSDTYKRGLQEFEKIKSDIDPDYLNRVR